MLQSYRKKPIVVKAIQVPAAINDFKDFMKYVREKKCDIEASKHVCFFTDEVTIRGHVQTDSGNVEFATGNWIIEDKFGEFYPIKNSIFKDLYEKV